MVLISLLTIFDAIIESRDDEKTKKSLVIEQSASATGIDKLRMEHYFDNEVRNTLDEESHKGLLKFLKEVCKVSEGPTWVSLEI